MSQPTTSPMEHIPGPPYPPQNAVSGGSPTGSLDVPVSAVFMALFMIGAASNMTISVMNNRRGHKFLIQNLLFGFCMARTLTCIMRIVWTYRLENVSVGIAAQIFVAAGVIILFIVNLIFTQRIIRASWPQLGWHKSIGIGFNLFYASVVCLLCALITCVVDSFYTLNKNSIRMDLDVEHVGQTYFAAAAFFPIPILLIGFLIPKPLSPDGVEKFGQGRHIHKVTLVLFTSTILSLGAAFRAGTGYLPRPRADPAWYHSKTCFYVFNFTIEIIVVYLYLFLRVDRMFHVPDGASGPGDYSAGSRLGGKSSSMFNRAALGGSVDDVELADRWTARARMELEGGFDRVEKKSESSSPSYPQRAFSGSSRKGPNIL